MNYLVLLVCCMAHFFQPTLTVTSSAFKNKEAIPKQYTCQGHNVNPPLSIEGIPREAKSLVLLVDDPDAPGGNFDHWVAWNLPLNRMIDENTSPGKLGKNGTGKTGYTGPCPPSGTHRYFFRVYALDNELSLKGEPDKQTVQNAMKGHVLAQGELMGTYKKE